MTVQMPAYFCAIVPTKTRTIERPSRVTVRRSEPRNPTTLSITSSPVLLIAPPDPERLGEAGEVRSLGDDHLRRAVHLEEHRGLAADRDHAEDGAALADRLDEMGVEAEEPDGRRREGDALLAERFEPRLAAPAVDVRRETAAAAVQGRERDDRATGGVLDVELHAPAFRRIGVLRPAAGQVERDGRLLLLRGGRFRLPPHHARAARGTRGADQVDHLRLDVGPGHLLHQLR